MSTGATHEATSGLQVPSEAEAEAPASLPEGLHHQPRPRDPASTTSTFIDLRRPRHLDPKPESPLSFTFSPSSFLLLPPSDIPRSQFFLTRQRRDMYDMHQIEAYGLLMTFWPVVLHSEYGDKIAAEFRNGCSNLSNKGNLMFQ
ncbi:unnamed protein product [Darwinula stevensoni]|uniref:Uncharacterized protein n=1 Tax=Darwinula stevensoni TaxID=69355 RepID=A0A7R9A298_9CRUS|nr:unnamed protein product [Darwinula stevensoni]CAG0888286.1 unnamed protein product [Darwinula stevensoni]